MNLRTWMLALLVLFIVGCTGPTSSVQPAPMPAFCSNAFEKGVDDAKRAREKDASFLKQCPRASFAMKQYQEGYDSMQPTPQPVSKGVVNHVPMQTYNVWVCEVESSSKVFTGVGATKEEALSQARGSCGSHFLTCDHNECRKQL